MHLTYEQAREHDLTVLYYTGLEIWLARNQLASYVVAQGGQPHLVYGPPSMRHAMARWTDEGEDRFYVCEAYERFKKQFRKLCEEEAVQPKPKPSLEPPMKSFKLLGL
jgi:hypothetical protein